MGFDFIESTENGAAYVLNRGRDRDVCESVPRLELLEPRIIRYSRGLLGNDTVYACGEDRRDLVVARRYFGVHSLCRSRRSLS